MKIGLKSILNIGKYIYKHMQVYKIWSLREYIFLNENIFLLNLHIEQYITKCTSKGEKNPILIFF